MAGPMKWLTRIDFGLTVDVVMTLVAFAILGLAFLLSRMFARS